jgi:hypothetical protein
VPRVEGKRLAVRGKVSLGEKLLAFVAPGMGYQSVGS